MTSDKAVMLLKCGHLELYFGHISHLGSKKEHQACDQCREVVEIVREATRQDLLEHRLSKMQGRLF